jgi:hypothetical protein
MDSRVLISKEGLEFREEYDRERQLVFFMTPDFFLSNLIMCLNLIN